MLTTTQSDGRYYYVESSGAALEAGARELVALEDAMQLFGLQFEVGQGIGETATGRALDAADALSPLAAMALNLEDSLNAMLALFAAWMDIPDFGSLSVASDISHTSATDTDMSFLMEARQLGDVSREELLREARRRGVLGDSLKANAAPLG
jgi:hypothetical protein